MWKHPPALVHPNNESFTLPQGTGPFRTTLNVSELIDSSRQDPFNTSHVRRLMISSFTPIPSSQCKELSKVPYMPPTVAAVEDEILSAYGYPKDIWGKFDLEVCSSTTYSRQDKFPITLFSPGLNTTRHFYSSLAQQIASFGFRVITIDHPYDVDVVEFPNGDVIYGGRVVPPRQKNDSTVSVEHALEVRAKDVSFVLDTLGITTRDKAIMIGQSFGGAATSTAMLYDNRIRGGINLDGKMFGPVLNTSLGTPGHPQAFLLWGSDGHNSSSDASWVQFWNILEGSKEVDYKKELSVVNSSHGSYWDLNLLVDVVGLRDGLDETALSLVGQVSGKRIWEILGRYLSAFFWFMLGEKEEDGVFKGPTGEFLDVKILH
ncbi:hypothetical protein K469DRAFT_764247 [Zopfia rhizophila CBS 207.26]|uniref:1-alkyl-2-acetylglycerophosphocholine esterase n=1 Tax=Zopfia rhizophila CBS 207.26 TaxID=1314779 RepID=A0A6A6EB68_9PEZI|nr:hypothetical protein K469DRAFT_764247 [Zopfia rhizophila CBS 207.26]